MTCARPRGVKDCCETSIRDQIKYIMSKIGSMVRSIRLNGETRHPDGEGFIDLGSISPGAELVDNTTYYTLNIFSGELVSLMDQGTYWEITVS